MGHLERLQFELTFQIPKCQDAARFIHAAIQTRPTAATASCHLDGTVLRHQTPTLFRSGRSSVLACLWLRTADGDVQDASGEISDGC